MEENASSCKALKRRCIAVAIVLVSGTFNNTPLLSATNIKFVFIQIEVYVIHIMYTT